jgi:hypothetical protein
MEFQAVEHAVLNIDPDEVRLCGSDELGHECAWNAMGYSHEGFAGICLRVCKSFPEVTGMGECGRTVGCIRMEVLLLAVGCKVRHICCSIRL